MNMAPRSRYRRETGPGGDEQGRVVVAVECEAASEIGGGVGDCDGFVAGSAEECFAESADLFVG